MFYGSCWPEVSLLLTHLQVPGIYVRPDSDVLMVLDHVEAHWVAGGNRDELVVTNPTDFPAEVTVMCDQQTIAGPVNPAEWLQIKVAARQTMTVTVSKTNRRRPPPSAATTALVRR